MKRIESVVVILVIMLGLLASCGRVEDREVSQVSKFTGIDLSEGNKIYFNDTHGGFHGDGVQEVVPGFGDDRIEEQIMESEKWKMFPLDDITQALVYGKTFADGYYGPVLNDNEGNQKLPRIEHGYYYLKDRQNVDAMTPKVDMLHRYSYNFTLAVYDVDNDILYYYKMDT